MKKRRLLLIVSVVVMLQLWYYGMRDFYHVSYRISRTTETKEETQVPDFLPPDTVIIPVGHRYGSIQRENHELIWGGIMKWVLGGVFLVWCLLKYLQEKRLTEFLKQRQRKSRQQEINIMLDKEKRWKEYEEIQEK
jgi:hypothetical protein